MDDSSGGDRGIALTVANLRSELQLMAQETFLKQFEEVGERIRQDCQEQMAGLGKQILEAVQGGPDAPFRPKMALSHSSPFGSPPNGVGAEADVSVLRAAGLEAGIPEFAAFDDNEKVPSTPSTPPAADMGAFVAEHSLHVANPKRRPSFLAVKSLKKSQVVPEDVITDPFPAKVNCAKLESIADDGSSRTCSKNSRKSQCKVGKKENEELGACAPSLGLEMLRSGEKKEQTKKRLWEMGAAELLQSNRFDNVIGALITLNAITIGVQTDYMARRVTDEVPAVFQHFERIFLVFFSAELFLRLYVHKLRFFYTGSVKWNLFDFLVVMSQLLEEIMLIVAWIIETTSSNAGSDEAGLGDFKIMRLLRILRLMRVLRVMRVLRLISELRTIVSSIAGSLKSLLWTVVLLVLMMYMVGIYFTQSITDYLVDSKDRMPSAEEKEGAAVLSHHFGDLLRSILSLYEAMSGGVDWDAVVSPMAKISPMMGIFFVMYVAFALLAMMNVVTGVFVQEALRSAKEEEDSFITEQIVNLFRMSELEGEKMISSDQVVSVVTQSKEWKSIDISPDEARYLFKLLDVGDHEEVKFEEFLSGCLRIHGMAKAIDVLTLMQEFRRFAVSFGEVKSDLEECFDEIHYIQSKVGAYGDLMRKVSDDVAHSSQVAASNHRILQRLEKRMVGVESTMVDMGQRHSDAANLDLIVEELRMFDKQVRPGTNTMLVV